ncbi:hypothetical protein E2562_021382 [Oryza meyeriana var. granulata]|uniref:Disease resistance N-terminal domain-containing protein n=1 Tax=Oryza meyeriana var. granulata TaxID=110450 RepID=A0A6G1EXJ8_9ORYZ|nr:hypothetical protein E2562_021382 [Oryza meyeriana var. granulata]
MDMRLGDLVIQEAALLSDVPRQVSSMKAELSQMECFLNVVDAKCLEGNSMMRNLASDIRDVAYRVEEEDRYLIVLDDIWTTDTWDKIKSVFPDKDVETSYADEQKCYRVAFHGYFADEVGKSLLNLRSVLAFNPDGKGLRNLQILEASTATVKALPSSLWSIPALKHLSVDDYEAARGRGCRVMISVDEEQASTN